MATQRSKITDQDIIDVAQNSKNAAEAVTKTGLTFNAYKYRAKKLGVYKSTYEGSGRKIDLNEILSGHHPQYQTFKLRNRLIKDGIKKNECENDNCQVGSEWLKSAIQCQLDHIDGDRFNHNFANLRMLCPNCHSQTDTYSGKNK